MFRFGIAANDAIHLYSLGQSGPAGLGNGGSSTPPPTGGPPPFVLPINFIPSQAPLAKEPNTGTGGTGNGGTGGISKSTCRSAAATAESGARRDRRNISEHQQPRSEHDNRSGSGPGSYSRCTDFCLVERLTHRSGCHARAHLGRLPSTLTLNGPVFTYTIDHDSLVDFLAAGGDFSQLPTTRPSTAIRRGC